MAKFASLDSITCPGSLGIISAYLQAPLLRWYKCTIEKQTIIIINDLLIFY